MAAMTGSARICVGEISTAHGVRGLVKLRSYCEDPDLLDSRGPLFTSETGDHCLTITLHNAMGTVWLASVEGVEDRTAAEHLRGTKLYLPRSEFPEIDAPGTYYHADLLGLRVMDKDGAACGTLRAIENFGAGDLLEIAPVDGPTYYLPFTESYVPKIDLTAGVITIDAPPELVNPAAIPDDEEKEQAEQ